ncbi:MAG: hypothetical protein WAT19_16420 [Ferruginibacter sp.]
MTFAALIGPTRAIFSWQTSVLAFAVFIALAWVLLQFLNIDKQIKSVLDLENKEAGK